MSGLTGERPFTDILTSIRYWVIHSITIPSLFINPSLAYNFNPGLAYDIINFHQQRPFKTNKFSPKKIKISSKFRQLKHTRNRIFLDKAKSYYICDHKCLN
uniref:Photosystem II cytochrome b559 N-terminal domain-containing protein n=1 Tax=Avrainvillea mazei TaxID=381412 RepID=A0A1X9RPW0_9CHLO|nr:hypothetical protein [Avrainvillea mazei]